MIGSEALHRLSCVAGHRKPPIFAFVLGQLGGASSTELNFTKYISNLSLFTFGFSNS
jgi:hypothetical protein